MTCVKALSRAAAAMLCVAVLVSTCTNARADDPPPTMQDAARLQQAGRWADAAEAWRQIAQAEPENAAAWFQLGYALHAAGQLEQAAEVHRRAAEFDDYRGIALYNLGCAHALMGNTDQAFEALFASQEAGFRMRGQAEDDSDLESLRDDPRFEALMAMEPSGFQAKVQQILGQLQQLKEQAPQIKQQVTMMAQQAMGKAMNALGQLQQKMAEDERLAPVAEALGDLLGKAMPHGSGEGGPSLEAAAKLQAQGRYLEAAGIYHVLAQASPQDPRPWFGLAYCLHSAGEYEAAIDAHQKAATFEATKGIALYNLACAYSMTGQLDKAMEALHASREAGFDLASSIPGDTDLDNLRKDPRFVDLLAELGLDR